MAYCTRCSSTVSGSPCSTSSQAATCRKKDTRASDSDFIVTQSSNDFTVSVPDCYDSGSSSCDSGGGGD